MDREILAEFVEYDPTSPSGLRWKKPRRPSMRAGDVAGSIDGTRKYWSVKVVDKPILCHRAIWVLFNKEVPDGMQIDHIDGDKLNNRIENLRLASASNNSMNTKLRKDNKAGVKGMWKESNRDRWCGQVMAGGKSYRKKSVKREVVEAWLVDTRNKLHAEFARHS